MSIPLYPGAPLPVRPEEGRVITARRAAALERYAAEPPTGLSPRCLNFYGHSFGRWQVRRRRRMAEALAQVANDAARRSLAPAVEMKSKLTAALRWVKGRFGR